MIDFHLLGQHIVLTQRQLLVAGAIAFLFFVYQVWWKRS